MKRLLNIAIVILALIQTSMAAGSYAGKSVLASGRWVRISVQDNGIQRITYSELREMGFSNPSDVKVFGYGGNLLEEYFTLALTQHPDDLPEVQSLHTGDALLFYGENTVTQVFDKELKTFRYTPNYCSDKAYYFLTADAGSGRKPTDATTPATADTTINHTYAGAQIQPEDVNLIESGRNWYGFRFNSTTNNYSTTLSIDNIDTSKPARIDINVISKAKSATSYDVYMNGYKLSKSISITSSSSSYEKGRKGTLNMAVEPASGTNTIKLIYNPTASSDYGYLKYITLTAQSRIVISQTGDVIITNLDGVADGKTARFNVTGAGSGCKVWDITDPLNIKNIPFTISGSTISFNTDHSTAHRFVAFNPAAANHKVSYEGEVTNQNLHAMETPDMVIVTSEQFIQQANTLAEIHRNHDGIKVQVATDTQIYNEFSSGKPDPTAIRWFAKMFHDRGEASGGTKTSSLLIFGNSSYDNRNKTGINAPLVSYQSEESLVTTSSYTTDDYYGFLDDSEGNALESDKLDISVGRLPVTTQSEANDCVNKIISYVNNENCGVWKNRAIFMGDDGDNNIHTSQANKLAERMYFYNRSYTADKIYLDAFKLYVDANNESYPDVHNKVLNDLKNGALIFTYVGHSSNTKLTAEEVVNQNDIKAMYNDNLAWWITASCEFATYDGPKQSAGMSALLNPNGGAIGLYTSTRVVYSSDNFTLSQNIFNHLIPSIGKEPLTTGEILRLAKVATGTDRNKLNYALLGDPAITLSYPDMHVVTDSINGSVPSEGVAKALGLVTLKGHIANRFMKRNEDFNGRIHIKVYDKQENVNTLSNRGNEPYTYTDYQNILFSGPATVNNGEFETTFMVPKDINYKEGKGRITYYASDEDCYMEANGYCEDITVGGTDTTVSAATEGPIIRMYLNNENFKSGQKVNTSPVLYAYMYDEFGINVVGSGIGHDITMTLLHNGKGTQTVLNDFYESTLNEYRSGRLQYQLTDLEEGDYTLTLKAWNMQNISGNQTIDFTVSKSVKPQITDFTVSPNPATDHATMRLVHDRPEQVITVRFLAYDLSGRLFYDNEVREHTDGVFETTWDFNGSEATVAATGMYIVEAHVTTDDGLTGKKQAKLIVYDKK